MLLKHLAAFSAVATACAQADIMPVRPGAQRDAHGCVTDGGYRWCESSQLCQREWETPCAAVAEPVSTCRKACPPPPPCPMPEMMPNNCVIVPAFTDTCGCTSGCPSIDCSHTSHAQEGQACGAVSWMASVPTCDVGLECVYSTGPVGVADTPGTCMLICRTTRDRYGNCISAATTAPQVPRNCVTWYDGCNTCSTVNGQLRGCTMMMCFTQNEPYCQAFAAGVLQIGDICYRFCEDGSQSLLDRRNGCPAGARCGSDDPSVASYDTCGARAHTCQPATGH